MIHYKRFTGRTDLKFTNSTLKAVTGASRVSGVQFQEATITDSNGAVQVGPETLQTRASTIVPARVTTITQSMAPVVVTTVVTSLLCTCEETALGNLSGTVGQSKLRRG